MANIGSKQVSNTTLAVTMGEPAGVGPELILKIWEDRNELDIAPFFVVGDPEYLSNLADNLKINAPVTECDPDEAAKIFCDALPVFPLSGSIKGTPTKPHEEDAKLVCESISRAVELTIDEKASGVVTAPINKNELYKSGFEFPGHTEYLAHLSRQHSGNKTLPVMMLTGPQLRVVPVTIHIAINEVPKQLTSDLILRTGKIVANDLESKFGIKNPRIAVAGLNPHAGENGSMGMEDIEVVLPAINALKDAGINAFGPLPADTLFHQRARENYDAVLCMYHDQALIPAKTLAFDESVNVTLGLPFIRTSPDHGTAYDIAGKGIANPTSMISAIKMAEEMVSSKQLANKT